MKKILWFMVLNLLWCSPSNSGTWGEGQLQLTTRVADAFIRYLKGGLDHKPAVFYVTLDGTDVQYWYCGYNQCAPGNDRQDIQVCESNTGKKCKKFAFRRQVRWKNGINPLTRKGSTFKSKWSDSQIYAKLTELGFYKNNVSANTTKEEITLDKDEDIVTKIIELKKLYDDGVISLEEFEKGKKKILN